MGLLFTFGFALLALVALWRIAGLRGPALQFAGAAILVGVAGYLWQGTPNLAGSPKASSAERKQSDSSFALERTVFFERFSSDAQILDAADAMHRAGSDAYGIALIRGALTKHPRSAELWVGMGNALTLYAQGMITPAADLAFRRAIELAPNHPGPPYFMGMAYAMSGQFEQADKIWSDLLARMPQDAPLRSGLERRLAQLREVEAQQ